jgi:hypothetical protein
MHTEWIKQHGSLYRMDTNGGILGMYDASGQKLWICYAVNKETKAVEYRKLGSEKTAKAFQLQAQRVFEATHTVKIFDITHADPKDLNYICDRAELPEKHYQRLTNPIIEM